MRAIRLATHSRHTARLSRRSPQPARNLPARVHWAVHRTGRR